MLNGEKRVKILPGKHRFVGEKMVKWALGEEPRPKSIEDLKKELGDAVELSPVLKKVEFIDTPLETALFRLPPREMVQASRNRVRRSDFEKAEYLLPSFYEVKAEDIALTPEQLFHARVADYTTGECG